MFLAQCLVERLADRATEMTSVVRAQEEDAFVGHIEAAAALLPAEDMGLYWRYLAYWLDQTGVG